MIYVNRTSAAIPVDLKGSQSAGQLEIAAAKKFYWRVANREKPYPFKAYKLKSVKDELAKLFHGKCAYCESQFRHISPEDIEHWRPKGAVKDENGKRHKPGYYWLAAEWCNLLPSCIDCNRRRRHRLRGVSDEDERTWEQAGKGMLFPLPDGEPRAKKPGQEANEHPLLLHPCEDDPERFLEFIATAADDPTREALVKPKRKTGRSRQRALRSIEVYGLNRKELVDHRKEHLLELKDDLAELKELIEDLDRSPNAGRARLEERIGRKVQRIMRRFAASAEYIAMGRQTVTEFLEKYPGLHAHLKRMQPPG